MTATALIILAADSTAISLGVMDAIDGKKTKARK